MSDKGWGGSHRLVEFNLVHYVSTLTIGNMRIDG